MKILALELSSAQGSVAWAAEGEGTFTVSFANDRKHSGLFFEHLRQCLQRCGQPDLIVVGLGPGSYAGTRIAIATAIGLRAAQGAQLIGLPSLCAIDTAATEYTVIGDARRGSFYFAGVKQRFCAEGPVLCGREELEAQLALTSSPVFTSEPLPAFPRATLAHPSAAILAQLASQSHGKMMPASLEPIYLREPHITQPKGPVVAR